MSKSRLEKFLYALYSLDSSDLPTPLSRIEELYKCLVTGEEAPIFKPLSRVEKYLMAILGAYDVDSLPNPLSRVEMLLYKLATGDDSLEDFDTFLSEHEELLAGIIGNGGVGGNIDIEYVLYTLSTESNTLYNTAEKPVKSAILKGDSQRVFSPTKNLFDGELEQGTVNSSTGINSDLSSAIRSKNFVEIGVNTAFTLSRKKGTASLGFRCYDKNKNFLGTIFSIIEGGTLKATHTTDSNTVYIRFIDNTNDLTNKYQIEIGSTATDYEEPNYELKTVKMPVLTTIWKNLFDISKEQKNITINIDNGGVDVKTNDRNTSDFIKVIPNTIYKCNVTMTRLAYYDKNKQFISLDISVSQPITIPSSCNFVKFSYDNALTNIQFERGSVSTSYEPFKTNILTVNEEVELRRIGDVKDTLDLTTGELVQNIHETTLNGQNDKSIINNNSLGYINYQGYMSKVVMGKNNEELYLQLVHGEFANSTDYLLKDGFLQFKGYRSTDAESEEGLYRFTGTDHAYLYIKTSRFTDHTLNGVKQFLSENPQTYYVLNKPKSIKTVDLSVVDQDGNNTKLKTFNDITHVTLSSEALIPEAELEVATKNEEVLNTMSLEMDDIFTTQTTLGEIVNTQSENVDATMIATTEIYEELL